MHEFSLAVEVIKVAEQVAQQNRASTVDEITIEVGNLSGVEADAFESALGLLTEGSILGKAKLNIIRLKGRGFCIDCKKEYEMTGRIDTCPVCHSFPSEIRGGNEFRIVSLLVDK